MSTRSNIALVKKGGAVEAVYCHHDGYPEGIGQTLAKCYGEEEEVAAMLDLGDMSILADTLETCVFYHRDFGGEKTAENTRAVRYASLAECVAAQDGGVSIEWLYLFADDCWWVRAWQGEGFYRLADVLSAVEQASAGRTRRRRRLPMITRRDDLKMLMDGQGVRPRAFTGNEAPPSDPPTGDPPSGVRRAAGDPPSGAPLAGARRSSRVRMDLVISAPQPR